MDSGSILEILLFLGAMTGLAWPLGKFIAKVLSGERHVLSSALGWLERLVNRACGVRQAPSTGWVSYAKALLVFNAGGFLLLFVLQLFQAHLPLNPAGQPGVPGWLAFNTAVSFVTNTNWQAYSGEATMSYLVQMLGLGVQNFLSAATGIAVVAALARGLAAKSSALVGNFWQDLTRTVVYILLPLSLVFAVVLVSQGVIQNFAPYATASMVDGGGSQTLPMGPAASQIAIKQLGSNGGGFFGVNSAHPFENPNPLTNFLELLAIVLLPAALPLAFGRMIGRTRHGVALFVAMMALFLGGLFISLSSDLLTNPALGGLPFLEGKETRFGVVDSILWSVATTATSNGSVNAMISSLSPLAGGVAMLNMMLGEVTFGGVGSGLYGMFLFVVLAVFIAGLMVGRTPEYLGKKIEAREIKLAVVGVLVPSVVILAFSALACLIPAGLSSLANHGPHGLSEILYAFASAAGNNGSAFAGLNANTPFYNGMIALAMCVGRFAVILPVLALAGSLGAKKLVPPSPGTFPTEGPLFVVLLVGTVLIIGALTFFPALSLGPVVEHLAMVRGQLF